jgi:hypothetical protein
LLSVVVLLLLFPLHHHHHHLLFWKTFSFAASLEFLWNNLAIVPPWIDCASSKWMMQLAEGFWFVPRRP